MKVNRTHWRLTLGTFDLFLHGIPAELGNTLFAKINTPMEATLTEDDEGNPVLYFTKPEQEEQRKAQRRTLPDQRICLGDGRRVHIPTHRRADDSWVCKPRRKKLRRVRFERRKEDVPRPQQRVGPHDRRHKHLSEGWKHRAHGALADHVELVSGVNCRGPVGVNLRGRRKTKTS
jgi:hypothetical protein